ncbi:MAG: hypothetical protein KDB07_12870 [Planctomycetes bacterium]|nr:hypothetical protein [Planctomycetota bacterium]
MKARILAFAVLALTAGLLIATPDKPSNAQRVAEDKGLNDEIVKWGDAIELKDGQVIDIKAGLKAGQNFTYLLTTRGESEVILADGSVGAKSSVINTIKVQLLLEQATLSNPKPKEKAPTQLAVRYQNINSHFDVNGTKWSLFIDQPTSVAKGFDNGKEVTSFPDSTGRPNPSSMRTHMGKSLGYAFVGEGNKLTNLAHAAFWEELPRDMPARLIDPISLMRLMAMQIGPRTLTVSMVDNKPSGEFSARGLELPVEIAQGHTALFDATFTLTGAKGGKVEKKAAVDGDVTNDGVVKEGDKKDESEESEIRLLSFDFVATPQPGQTIALGSTSISPKEIRGSVDIDPRSGMVVNANLNSAFAGQGAKGTLELRFFVRNQNLN